MTHRDSNLVKSIRRLERMAKKATIWDIRNGTALGYAAETLDHIIEVVNEHELDIAKKLKEEKEAR